MRRIHVKRCAAMLSCVLSAGPLGAQEMSVVNVIRPSAPVILRPYKPTTVPEVRLTNSNRLQKLVRAGKLYLTVQDAIALAIENNLDLEFDRYGPLIAQWQVQRAEAGGVLRGVTGGNTAVGQVASGQGVVGSQRAIGVNSSGNGGNGSNGGAVISQIGPVTANLDPVLQNTTLFSHTTSPQVNTLQSQTTALVDTAHIYNTFVQQGLITGGYVQVSANESYLKENTPTDILNPSVAPRVQIYLQHSLLQGFGLDVNSRFIRVARKSALASQQTFRSQLLNVVVNVVNLYWDLVSDSAELSARTRSRDVAQKFFDDTKTEIALGAMARVEIYRAEGELAARQREVTFAQTNVTQQENQLKNAISRNGMQDPLIDEVQIVPLDSITVPESDNLPSLRELATKAIAQRPDLGVTQLNLESAEISALGTASGILPNAQLFLSTYNSGLSGTSNPQPNGIRPDPYFVGGLGNALGQVFRRDFPNNRVGAVIQAPIGNHISQGDYGIDQLQLRQSQLSSRRDQNKLLVDISSQLVALRQARARHTTAQQARILNEQLLDKEQENFRLGGSTINDLIVAQRSLLDAESAEVAALSAFSHARVALDQVTGSTLETYNISIDEARGGLVGREPAVVPQK